MLIPFESPKHSVAEPVDHAQRTTRKGQILGENLD